MEYKYFLTLEFDNACQSFQFWYNFMWCNEWQVIAFAGHTNFHMGRAEQGKIQIYFRFDKLSKIRDKNQWMMFW